MSYTVIYQAITTGIFSDQLKFAKVVLIFKKNVQTNVKNYRPISVIPTIFKMFENVLQTQLMEYFKSHNVIASQQYGFRSNRSTERIIKVIEKCTNFYFGTEKLPPKF